MERQIKERKIGLQFVEVPAQINYWALQVPTYESAFSTSPRWKDNANDQFICTAVFRKSYIEKINKEGGTLSRSADNMLPAFFVYESDELTVPEQYKICNEIRQDPLVQKWIFSQTFSGSKSIHTLVYIAPEFREEVAKDFRYYWRVVGERIFGSNLTSMLDSQCASIGRLSRNPNGVRDNGIKQVCIYYNDHFDEMPINLSNWITEHNVFLHKMKVQYEADQKRRQEAYANAVDEHTKLERIHNKGGCSESFNLAYQVLVEDVCPKGADYVSAAASLKGCGFSREFIEELLNKASAAHPTNIPKRSIGVILRRLNV